MSRINTIRDAWHPQTREDRDAVLLELHEVLASPHFCNSKRYPALLQYIVEHTLAGKSDLLKERTLGVEVFDRQASYDTNTDTVVRYTAGEVRKRLSLYYHEHGRNSRIHILLPAGSYVPEFVYHEEIEADADVPAPSVPIPEIAPEAQSDASHGTGVLSVLAPTFVGPHTGIEPASALSPAPAGITPRRVLWWSLTVVVAALLLTGGWWKYHANHTQQALDGFWGPVLRDQRTVPICAGSSVFAPNNFSGVLTAGKDIEYPFVSMQIASSIARLSGLLQQHGTAAQLLSSASTPLTELRERPVILLGGYNNKWTIRLMQPLRFHFPPEPEEAIVDQTQPQSRWTRDRSLPYASADDYALIARFRDPTTNSWVVVVAGLGRNGTEGAAQFLTSTNYMQQLRDRLGSDFGNKNIEALLKVSVIDGKTAAPEILTTHTW